MEKSLKEQAIKYANHFGSLLDVPCAVVDLSEKNYTPAGEGKPFDACANCPHKNCKGYEQFAEFHAVCLVSVYFGKNGTAP